MPTSCPLRGRRWGRREERGEAALGGFSHPSPFRSPSKVVFNNKISRVYKSEQNNDNETNVPITQITPLSRFYQATVFLLRSPSVSLAEAFKSLAAQNLVWGPAVWRYSEVPLPDLSNWKLYFQYCFKTNLKLMSFHP